MAATQELVTVQLSRHAAALLQQAQEQRGYDSPSEVLEEALRGWSETPEEVEALRSVCQAAIDDTRPGLAPGPVFDRLEQRLQASADPALLQSR